MRWVTVYVICASRCLLWKRVPVARPAHAFLKVRSEGGRSKKSKCAGHLQSDEPKPGSGIVLPLKLEKAAAQAHSRRTLP